MKRGRASGASASGHKWKTVRVIPNEDFTNAIEVSQTRKDRLNSLDEYIEIELKMQTRILKYMGCDENASAKAIDALREAYQTSPGHNKK